MTIVVVDDDRINLGLIRRLVGQIGHEVETFADAESALLRLADLRPMLLITDYRMPGMDGLELVERLRERPHLADMPILMVTSSDERRIRLQAFAAGVTDFLTKPIDPTELRARAQALLRLSEAQAQLRGHARALAREVDRATSNLAAREAEIILRLARAADQRDHDTGDHVARVAAYARLIADQLGLPEEQVRIIHLAAPLHDVGKIGIPDQILLKPGRLTTEERALMEQHTGFGEEILGGSNWTLLQVAADIAAAHHERWDGRGYPRGLTGAEIPLASRIVAVADVFDALVSPRSYKRAWSLDEARRYVEAERGSHFDPDCVDAFLARWDEVVGLARPCGHGGAGLAHELEPAMTAQVPYAERILHDLATTIPASRA